MGPVAAALVAVRAGRRSGGPADIASGGAFRGARVVEIERARGDFARGHDAAAKGSSSRFVRPSRGGRARPPTTRPPTTRPSTTKRLRSGRPPRRGRCLDPGPGPRRRGARAGFGPQAPRARHPRPVTADICGHLRRWRGRRRRADGGTWPAGASRGRTARRDRVIQGAGSASRPATWTRPRRVAGDGGHGDLTARGAVASVRSSPPAKTGAGTRPPRRRAPARPPRVPPTRRRSSQGTCGRLPRRGLAGPMLLRL